MAAFMTIANAPEVTRALCMSLAIDADENPAVLNSPSPEDVSEIAADCSTMVKKGFVNQAVQLLNWIRDSKAPPASSWTGAAGNAAKLRGLIDPMRGITIEMVGRRFWRTKITGWKEFTCALLALKAITANGLLNGIAKGVCNDEEGSNAAMGARMYERAVEGWNGHQEGPKPERGDYLKDYSGSEKKWRETSEWLAGAGLHDIVSQMLDTLSDCVENDERPDDVVAMLKGLGQVVQPGTVSGAEREKQAKEARAKEMQDDEDDGFSLGAGPVVHVDMKGGKANKKAPPKKSKGKKRKATVHMTGLYTNGEEISDLSDDDDWLDAPVATEAQGTADPKA